jgi:hypothetical protein
VSRNLVREHCVTTLRQHVSTTLRQHGVATVHQHECGHHGSFVTLGAVVMRAAAIDRCVMLGCSAFGQVVYGLILQLSVPPDFISTDRCCDEIVRTHHASDKRTFTRVAVGVESTRVQEF